MASDAQAWAITTGCRWCGGAFTKLEIDHVRAWVCETEACRERQLKWKRVDLAGKLFYLPMPNQVELHEAIESQQYGSICLGGERGSAKSIAVRNAIYNACDPREGTNDPPLTDLSVLFFRKQLGQLELNQWQFFEREAARIGADWNAKKLVFPRTGSAVRPAHSNKPDDYESYIGGDLDLIVMEQVEQFSQKQFAEIGASVGRSTRLLPYWRGLMLTTENPGGPLSDFVNQVYVRKDLDRTKYPNYDPSNFHFIECRLADNPWTDSRYEKNLAILSPARRAMFRHGRRDVFEHQFFADWLRETHVDDAVDTRGAKWFASMRFGFNQPGSLLVWAVLPDRRLYIRAELRLEGLNEDALVAAAKTLCASMGLRVVPTTFANPEIFNRPKDDKVVGQSIAETLRYCGLTLIEGDADAVNGNKRCHALLRESPFGTPWLRVHSSCVDLIHAITNAMSDEDDADLLNPESPSLASLEAFRLGAMSRPAPDQQQTTQNYPPYSAGWLLQRAMREEQRAH